MNMVSCGQHLLQRQACYAVPDCCDLKPAADQADRLDSINWIVTSDGSCSAGSAYRISSAATSMIWKVLASAL
jgi:hypothetical protein